MGYANIVFNLLEPKGKFSKGLGANDGRGYDTSLGQRIVLCDLKDGLCLVVKFRTDMSSCIVVAFVEMKDRLDMDVLLACPLH